ncbi:hypothetical protein [Peribacillus sp. R9-11]|uniref:hypothetical protein n=1 Tax=Peribacillus sp. R9-11 TaxID=3073271 RepID=UPI002869474B|nr:hypothetical protein [Peribacillus sp. R9-11]WMX58513.1 hypothetical protein RE409_28785 [Peribacillus sp. R9-11]
MFTRNKVLKITFLFAVFFSLSACKSDSESSNGLEKGATYIGKNATFELIEVNSNDSWTIKSQSEDDTNYSVVSVDKTGDTIDEYPIIELTVTEVMGDIDSRFAKREGRQFIMIQDGNDLYFKSISDEIVQEMEEKLKKTDEKDDLIKKLSNFNFVR